MFMTKIIACLFALLCCCACGGRGGSKTFGRKVTDALGREVALPDTVRRAVCIRASAIRLVVYAGGASCLCGVEEQETRNREYTHILAHPGLARKPVIGPGMGGDAELIVTVCPEVIFMSCTTAGDADELQRRTGIPVFTIEYGDLGRNRPVFYRSLRQIGEVLHTEDRVDTLIAFIDAQIADLRKRTAGADKDRKVYVGGISYKGQKGIVSTDPYYAAFGFLGVDNVASALDSAYVSPVNGADIDWEQLVSWDPDVIFVDAGGWPLVREEFGRHPGLNRLLKAHRTRQLYALWPYNNHHSNFEVMLTNAWYAGKVLYPECFGDISMEEKADEVMTRFVGAPIAPDLAACWGKYRNLAEEP